MTTMDRAHNGGQSAPPPGGAERGGPRKKKKRFSVGRLIGGIFLTLFTLCVIGVLTAAIFFKIFMTYVNTTLIPSLGDVSAQEMTLSLASTIYDKNGAPILTLFDNSGETGGNRELIEYSDLPKHLVDALVAIEDHRFWDHNGVDWYGTARATIYSVTGSKTQGGSTITQQVVRAIYDDKEVTVKRKLREIFRALEFDKNTSKEDIITMYLNRVYFGNGCYGIQTAAKSYFGKDVSELTLAESAAIVGITNNPSLYDPFRDAKFLQDDGTYKTCRDFNKSRQEDILNRMASEDVGFITEAECEAAKAEKLLFTDTPEYKAKYGLTEPEPSEDEEAAVDLSKIYTWFEDAAIDEAITLIMAERGVGRDAASLLLYNGGYHIYTTLDPDIQAIVDEIYQNPANFDYPSNKGTPLDSAITIVDPYTGDVKAMAGGVGVKTVNRGLNLATARRTPGSSIKPVSIYAPALEYDVMSPMSVVDDYPIRVNDAGTGGFPKNSPIGHKGHVTITYGIQRSINTVASRTLQAMGESRSFEFMEQKLGFDLDSRDLALSPLAMGGLTYGVTTVEMAAAYGAFVNEGVYTAPRTVTRIESNDHSEVIVDNSPASTVAMKKTTAYLMNKMLRNAVTSGTGGSAAISGMTVAGKTGTTNDNYDRYFAGYTPYYSAAVWVGYKDKPEYIPAGSKNPAALAWKMVMEKVHEGLEDKSFFERPEGITSVQVCADCGLKPSALCALDYRGSRVVSGEIQASAAPSETCTCHIEVQVCTDPATGTVRLAGEYCPEETVTTRVMLQGRTFLEIPYGYTVTNEDGTTSTGWPLLADDSDAHLTYFSTLGTCRVHDENYMPEPGLPGEEGDLFPGGSGWPVAPFDPSNPDGSGEPEDPGAGEPDNQPEIPDPNPNPNPNPDPDPDPGTGEDGRTDPGVDPGVDIPEPVEPTLPDEPVLP